MSSKWKDKEFVREYQKEYRQKNKGKAKGYNKKYYQKPEVKAKQKVYLKEYKEKNKGKISKQNKEYNKEYYQKNKKVLLKKNKLYYLKNKDNINKWKRKYRKTSKVKQIKNEQRKQRKQNDERFRCIENMRSHFWYGMNLYSKTGKIMSSNKYGIDWSKVYVVLGPPPKDGNEYHLDHIIPLSWFDHNNFLEIRWAWSPGNLQWLTKEENMWKGNRFIFVK